MDNLNPNLVWYLSGLIGLVAVAGYLWLQGRSNRRIEVEAETESSEVAA